MYWTRLKSISMLNTDQVSEWVRDDEHLIKSLCFLIMHTRDYIINTVQLHHCIDAHLYNNFFLSLNIHNVELLLLWLLRIAPISWTCTQWHLLFVCLFV
jgi:hypothetical protein